MCLPRCARVEVLCVGVCLCFSGVCVVFAEGEHPVDLDEDGFRAEHCFNKSTTTILSCENRFQQRILVADMRLYQTGRRNCQGSLALPKEPPACLDRWRHKLCQACGNRRTCIIPDYVDVQCDYNLMTLHYRCGEDNSVLQCISKYSEEQFSDALCPVGSVVDVQDAIYGTNDAFGCVSYIVQHNPKYYQQIVRACNGRRACLDLTAHLPTDGLACSNRGTMHEMHQVTVFYQCAVAAVSNSTGDLSTAPRAGGTATSTVEAVTVTRETARPASVLGVQIGVPLAILLLVPIVAVIVTLFLRFCPRAKQPTSQHTPQSPSYDNDIYFDIDQLRISTIASNVGNSLHSNCCSIDGRGGLCRSYNSLASLVAHDRSDDNNPYEELASYSAMGSPLEEYTKQSQETKQQFEFTTKQQVEDDANGEVFQKMHLGSQASLLKNEQTQVTRL